MGVSQNKYGLSGLYQHLERTMRTRTVRECASRPASFMSSTIDKSDVQYLRVRHQQSTSVAVRLTLASYPPFTPILKYGREAASTYTPGSGVLICIVGLCRAYLAIYQLIWPWILKKCTANQSKVVEINNTYYSPSQSGD